MLHLYASNDEFRYHLSGRWLLSNNMVSVGIVGIYLMTIEIWLVEVLEDRYQGIWYSFQLFYK